jgi:hypothetical protein
LRRGASKWPLCFHWFERVQEKDIILEFSELLAIAIDTYTNALILWVCSSQTDSKCANGNAIGVYFRWILKCRVHYLHRKERSRIFEISIPRSHVRPQVGSCFTFAVHGVRCWIKWYFHFSFGIYLL